MSGPIDRKAVIERIILSGSSAGASFLDPMFAG
jgi:hypothetical protein